MKKQFFALFNILFVLTLFPTSALSARSIVISSDKNTLSGDEEMVVTASISGFTNTEKIYLKGAFFSDGSTNYFGYTKHNNNWIKNSEGALGQKEVQIGIWDLFTNIKSDYVDAGFKGKGEYNFKLGFYYLTSGGNLSSINWSENILKINLDPPQIQSNTPTPTSYQVSSKTPTLAKNTQPIATVSRIPTMPIISTNSTKSSNFDKIHSDNSEDIDQQINSYSSKDEENKELKVLGTSDKKKYSWLWIGTGIIFILTGLIYFGYKIAKSKNII